MGSRATGPGLAQSASHFPRLRARMSRTSASVSPAHAECEEDLKKAHDGVAVDAEADHAAGAVDLRDRVCRNESAAAGEEAGTDSDRIGNVGRRPVHRAFDRPDHAAARVGDEKAGRSEKLRSGHAHAGGTYTGPVTENRSRRKRFVNHHSPGFGGPAVTPSYNRPMDVSARHLRLLTETIAAVNSTLDLEEVLGLVARKVAEALEADACFVYLYDDQAGELVLRATHGTRFEAFPNLPEDQYESILAVPILARDKLAGALNVRTIEPREFSAGEMDLLVAIAHHAAVALEHGRAVMRGVPAQEIHHRVKNNLQTVASLLRLQARSDEVDPRKALEDSVNRILAIAAVHEVLTQRRDEEVDLEKLLDRLRSMLVQGLGAEKTVNAQLEPILLAGDRATALALVFSELLQNALEHGGSSVRVELAQRNGQVVLAIADDGAGITGEEAGTGLSIVRALVRDELRGTLDLYSNGGLRAEVVFPA